MSDHERIAAPEGYVLVPKEMTEAMLKAGMRGRLDSIENMGDVMATWNAIIAAAGEPASRIEIPATSQPSPNSAEPVAWQARDPSGKHEFFGGDWFAIDKEDIDRLWEGYIARPLFASPPYTGEVAEAMVETESLDSQIDRLADFIMAEVPGEPSQSEGAIDTAIRWMRAALAVSVPGKAEDEESETGETAGELEFQRDIMADALRQIADATGTYVSIAIFAVNTAKQVLSCAAPSTDGGE